MASHNEEVHHPTQDFLSVWADMCNGSKQPQDCLQDIVTYLESIPNKHFTAAHVARMLDQMFQFVSQNLHSEAFDGNLVQPLLLIGGNVIERFVSDKRPADVRAMNVISDQGGVRFAEILELVVERTAQMPEIHPDLVNAWLEMFVGGIPPPAQVFLGYSRTALETVSNNTNLQSSAERIRWMDGNTKMLHMLCSILLRERLVVLDLRQQKGFEVIVDGIADNSQLRMLIQQALTNNEDPRMLDGNEVDEETLSVYDGSGPMNPGRTTTEDFFMMNWLYWKKDMDEGDFRSKIVCKIMGEGVPFDIAPFEGTRVMLLIDPMYRKGEPVMRMFDALPASCVLDKVLNREEYDEWLRTLESATPDQRAQAVEFLTGRGTSIGDVATD